MSRQPGQPANQLADMRNSVRTDVRSILENFSEMLSLAKPDSLQQTSAQSLPESSARIATVTQISQDYLELSTRAANLVRACHLLKRQVLEMKRALILDDFSWIHDVTETANKEERQDLLETRRILEATRDRLFDIQYDLEEEACAATIAVSPPQ